MRKTDFFHNQITSSWSALVTYQINSNQSQIPPIVKLADFGMKSIRFLLWTSLRQAHLHNGI